MSGADLVSALGAVVLGYGLGSLPIASWVGRAFGVDVLRDGDRNPGSANVWTLAGPRAGSIALGGDIGKGIVATLAGWGLGGFLGAWVAGLAALIGHAWPALGRSRGGRAVATFAGVCIGLAPLQSLAAIAITIVVLAIAGRVPAIAAGIGSLPIIVALTSPDVIRLAALGILYLVAAILYARSGRRA